MVIKLQFFKADMQYAYLLVVSFESVIDCRNNNTVCDYPKNQTFSPKDDVCFDVLCVFYLPLKPFFEVIVTLRANPYASVFCAVT